MKLLNTTDLPDYALRRMISWTAKELGLPLKHLRQAKFRNRRNDWSGRAWHDRIVISLPTNVPRERRVSMLVQGLAHELAHLFQRHVTKSKTRKSRRYGTVRLGGSESATIRYQKRVEKAFEENRATLEASWFAVPGNLQPKQKKSRHEQLVERAEKRIAVTEIMLVKWQKKLKLAATKLKKYQRALKAHKRRLDQLEVREELRHPAGDDGTILDMGGW